MMQPPDHQHPDRQPPDRRPPDRQHPDRRQPGHDDDEFEPPVVERTGVLADDPTAPPAVPERRWHALARLMGVESPTLAPLVRMSPLPDGVALTHRLPADSVSLADLRASAPLRAGHALTVALAVAEALVDLDEHGLAHGAVSADRVVVGPDGSVVLAACGLAWRRPPGDVDGPRMADDVAALGELVRDLLGAGSSPSSLVLAALRAADADAALRPTPRELTAVLRRCGRADPLLDALWGGGTRRGSEEVVVEPVAAVHLRIDPRTAPGQDAAVQQPPGVAERVVPEGTTSRARSSAPRRPDASPRPGAPRRPASPARRTPRPRRGPWVIVLVSVLAALALGAVRVGARAMADGPVGGAATSTGSPAVVASAPPDAVASSDPTSSSRSATPTGPGSADPAATAADATTAAETAGGATEGDPSAAAGIGDATSGTSLDLDRGAASSAPDWTALLAAADAGRQSALAAGDAAALATWVDPEGSTWAADAALAARVTALGAQIDGGALVVLDVHPRRVTSSDAVLLVQDRRDAYTVTTAAGTSSVPARAPRWWQVTLRRTTDSDGAVVWRVRDVAPVAAPTG